MVRRAASRHQRFLASTGGIAAVEFALVLPILVMMFLASVDAGRAIALYMKVRAATYTLDAITNQYTTIQSTDVTSIVGAASLVFSPYSAGPAVVTVSQISVNSATNATVSWSYSQNGTALSQGTKVSVPSGFSTCGTYPCYLIYGQISYTYSPLFGFFTRSGIHLSDSLFVTPRNVTCILYPPGSVSSC
jgi:Flp pilus assembly protein TadG